MQVSHHKDHITHAVIGGGQAIDFGISSSAEFFHILSSTLYKDQILAVVREVLCNGWDAHIEAGRTHVPVEITLTPEKFVIKDSGKGIHKDDMGLIYGTYGNSTKKNDGQQTGGFGLGCKAPFAYTDHFEVISCHDGVKTIYNLSKSSAQAMGKPGIIPIASFPCTETGLQVSIAIKNSQDFHRFGLLIRRIARNGDMNMTFNGKPLEKLDFDTSKSNYLIVNRNETQLLDQPSPIMVRYGNVIYPVDKVSALAAIYDRIANHLGHLDHRQYTDYQLVLQAPPHSITVQPSREGLSMQEHTIKTLTQLFADFLAMLDGEFKTVCTTYAETTIQKAVKEAMVAQLLSTDERLPTTEVTLTMAKIGDLDTMAKRYMECNYPKTLEFRKRDIAYRLNQMVAGGLLGRGPVQTYLRAMEKVNRLHDMNREDNNWLQRQVLAPLLSNMLAQGIDHKRLYVYDPMDSNASKSYYIREMPPLVEATRARPPHLFQALPYLRNIVVVATSRSEIKERAFRQSAFKELGAYPGFLFYQVSMKKQAKELAIDFFEKQGMTVVDLAAEIDYAAVAQARKNAPKVPKKPVKKGLPSLKGVKIQKGILLTLARKDDAPFIEAPEFLMAVSYADDVSQYNFPHWDEITSAVIVDLFGAKGAITNNSAIHAKWLAKGAVEGDAYIRAKVCEFMMNSPEVKEYWAYRCARIIEKYNLEYGATKDFLRIIYTSPVLRKEFGLVNNLSDEARKYVSLWNYLTVHRDQRNQFDDLRKVKAYLNTIPLHPANDQLMARIKDNEMFSALSEHGLARLLKSPTQTTVDKAIKLLLTALN